MGSGPALLSTIGLVDVTV
uniref:Uncharacterized protein n=1 Tax=Moniliophthora roreri TaxID=221103 RepID=A0A0W0FV71_MONRR